MCGMSYKFKYYFFLTIDDALKFYQFPRSKKSFICMCKGITQITVSIVDTCRYILIVQQQGCR